MIFCIKQFRSSEIWAVCSKSSVQKITSNFQVIRIFGVLIFEILLYWIRFICLQKYLNACAVVTHHVFSKINVTHTNTNKRKTNFVRTSRIRYANNSCAAKINESNFDIVDFLLPEVYFIYFGRMACTHGVRSQYLSVCMCILTLWKSQRTAHSLYSLLFVCRELLPKFKHNDSIWLNRAQNLFTESYLINVTLFWYIQWIYLYSGMCFCNEIHVAYV